MNCGHIPAIALFCLVSCGEALPVTGGLEFGVPRPPPDASNLGPAVDASIAVPDGSTPDAQAIATDAHATDAQAPALDAPFMPAPVRPGSCEPFAGLTDHPLLDALHHQLSTAYQPIDVENDLGGMPNRYTTSRRRMFVEVEPIEVEGELGFECVYTGQFFPGAGIEPDEDALNCEHVWPRSRMAARDTLLYSHQQSDLHNLYPSLPGANSSRGNLPYGEVVGDRNLDWWPTELGTNALGQRVCEVRDARKGDLARAILYFAVRWGADVGPDEESTLKAWHTADAPDLREATRNDRVEAVQGNRNPFVDCPELVLRIADFGPFLIVDDELSLPSP